MKIASGMVVALEYRIHLGDGVVIDSSDPSEPLVYLHGSGNIVTGLEKALEGLEAGATRQVVVTPAEGYGDADPDGVQEVPHDAFGGEIPEAGFHGFARDQEGNDIPFVVREVRPTTVIVDLNHPLAGKTLHFDVKVVEVRAPTEEELEHGHAHGADGHHHHD